MSVDTSVVLKKAEQAVDDLALSAGVFAREVIVHAYVHGTAYGVIHVDRCIISGVRPS